jgi:hypothetical protein
MDDTATYGPATALDGDLGTYARFKDQGLIGSGTVTTKTPHVFTVMFLKPVRVEQIIVVPRLQSTVADDPYYCAYPLTLGGYTSITADVPITFANIVGARAQQSPPVNGVGATGYWPMDVSRLPVGLPPGIKPVEAVYTLPSPTTFAALRIIKTDGVGPQIAGIFIYGS